MSNFAELIDLETVSQFLRSDVRQAKMQEIKDLTAMRNIISISCPERAMYDDRIQTCNQEYSALQLTAQPIVSPAAVRPHLQKCPFSL
jgi:hypothetical protein